MADGKFNLFGRGYEFVGKEGADFCIKTKGKVKIKWGNKYIDLVKDGKINVDVGLLKKVHSIDEIGNKDGIYITDDGEIVIVFDGNQYPIYGNEATASYVAYVPQEGKTGEERQYALLNIGSVFNTVEEYSESGIQNGLAYIIDEMAIYMMQNGTPVKLELKIPNPVTEPITVKIESGDYALLLEGFYSENKTKFHIGKIGNSLAFYAESDFKYIESETPIKITIGENDVVTLDKAAIHMAGDLHVKNGYSVESDEFVSIGGNEDDGFMLIEKDGVSTLYVDNIVERNDPDNAIEVTAAEFYTLVQEESLDPGKLYDIAFQNEWDCTEERTEDEYESEPDYGITNFIPANVHHLMIRARTEAVYEPFGYFRDNKNWIIRYDNIEIDTGINITYDTGGSDGEVTERLLTYGRIVYMRDEFGNEANFDFKHLRFYNEATHAWDFTFRYRNEANSIVYNVLGDGSLTGEIRDNRITVDFDKLKREDFPNRAYVLGGNGILRIDGKPVNNVIGTISGSFMVLTGVSDDEDIRPFHDNVFNCGTMTDVIIESDFYNNNIETDGTFGVDAANGFFNNTVDCGSLSVRGSEVSYNRFYGGNISINMTGDVKHNMINGNSITASGDTFCYNTVHGEISNCTLAPSMRFCHFNGIITGQNFTLDGNGIFGSDKHVDIYVNDGELRTICMPDTIFPGMVVMYDGRKPVPTGWLLCDGSNGTPDLIDRFVKGSTIDGAGQLGGNENGEIVLKVENLPPHSHDVKQTVESEDAGSHSHDLTGSFDTSTGGSHEHNVVISGSTDFSGEHTHTIGMYTGESDNANDRNVILPGGETETSESGSHYHNVDVSGYSDPAGDHSHTVNIDKTTTTDGTHNHSIILDFKTEDTGEAVPINIEPPYYTLVFIMYVGYSDIYY